MIESDAQPTDFESLIEMHRKHITENRDNTSSINVCNDLTNQNRSSNNNWQQHTDSYTSAQKSLSPKCITDINCVLINSSNIPTLNLNDNIIHLKRDHRQLNDCQQMDIDDQSISLISPPPISSAIEKNSNNSITLSSGINKLSPVTKAYDHFIGKKTYINNISSFDEQNNYKENRLYEENQNNQNFLNQNCDPNNANNQGDDSMWRPW